MTIRIIADSREARSSITLKLQAMPNLDVEVKELSCGDYLLREDFAIERKSAVDFVVSIMDGRLFTQVARMKADFGRAVLIVEGDIYATRSAIAPEALRGAMSYLVALEGSSIIPSAGTMETASLLATMARHLQEGLGYEVPLRRNKPKDLRMQAQFVVEGLTGVGPGTAKRLLRHFGTVGSVFSADVPALRKVVGIGEKTAVQIRELIEVDCAHQEEPDD